MRVLTRCLVMAAIVVAFIAQPAPAAADSMNDALISAVNAYRAARGLSTVVASPSLQAAAQFMADDVARYGAPPIPHVSHDGRTARQRMADAGYPVASAFTSEIIAWGAPTVDGAMRLWDNSPPHHAELNDPRYRAAGFGVSCAGAFPCVWVVTFGSIVDAVYAPPPDYHATFYAQTAYPVAAPGEVVEWVIAFTNTGSLGWYVGSQEAHLGTTKPQDAPSTLSTTAWLSANRPARQTTTYVGPGQQAWFRVQLHAPAQPGTYRLYVRPVIDGVEWLEDVGAYVDLIVR
jgi:hypothetical protein